MRLMILLCSLTFVNQIGLFPESWWREPPGGLVAALGSSDVGTGSLDRSVGGGNATVRRIRAFRPDAD
jgi:hypothetical protein